MNSVDLFLLRHGDVAQPGRLIGHLDVECTDAGMAECLGSVAGLRPGTIVSSTSRRSTAAAHAIAASHRLDVRLEPRWRELCFGAWEGRTTAEIERLCPGQLERFWQDPDSFPPPGGERWTQLVKRVAAATEELLVARPGEPVLVVTHAGAMRAALAAICGFGFAQAFCFDLPHAACLQVRVFGRDGRIAGGSILSLRSR
jgi:alpha-ribazole phosphatase